MANETDGGNSATDRKFMTRALELAREAAQLDEVPVGAVVVHEGEIIAEGFNLREKDALATHHAELKAIEAACRKLGRWRLTGCTIYITLEPCVMCAGAIVNARVDRVVYGAKDPKAGAVESLYRILGDDRLNHRPAVEGGVMGEECGRVLTGFFRKKREKSE
jgi:tRNA(adenine34) deaminase